MAVIAGIASSHDASACVLRDGRLVAAVSQERITRRKSDGYRLPLEALDHALATAGLSRRDVDAVASIHGFFPERYFRRESLAKELESRLVRARRARRGDEERHMNVNDLLKRLSRRGVGVHGHFREADFLEDLGFRSSVRVAFFDHHLTHAAAAAHASGFERCAVVTIDGVGDLNQHFTAGVFAEGRLETRAVGDTLGASPGEYYEAITKAMGFIPLRHEGKVLGLAARGDPARLHADFRRALRAAPGHRGFDSDFAGRPDAMVAREAYLAALVKANDREHVAAAAQRVFEEEIEAVVRAFLRETGERRLAVNGGVFANVLLNQRLARLPELDDLYVFPAMSDTGNSVGAAVLLQAQIDPGFLRRAAFDPAPVYLGSEWSDEDCRRALEDAGLRGERLEPAVLVERAARAIHAGRVVGWFQGRMEFGPRALGNRSMVARPTEHSINDLLNARLDRSEFMPFAPSVLAEHADEIFEDAPRLRRCTPFMTATCSVRPEWRARIPAVVHVDGTARPQTVTREHNALYWSLIDAYRRLSGIPLVLNTSFNVHEEPIVCFPQNAVRALVDNRVDALALGSWWAERASS